MKELSDKEERYKILQCDDRRIMCDVVNEYIAEGWRPIGGVQYYQWSGNYPGKIYTQAIVCDDVENKDE